MSDPIVDLTPTQVTLQEDQAAKEGFIKRDLIAVDECTGEVLFDAPPDETISTETGIMAADDHGIKKCIGTVWYRKGSTYSRKITGRKLRPATWSEPKRSRRK